MSVYILTIPFDPERQTFHGEELTRFLLNKRVKSLRPEFFQQEGRAYWSVFVEYEVILSEQRKEKEDAPDLDELQKVLLQKLREWRKETAEKEGVPVYIIATNSQLVKLIEVAPVTLEALRQIEGFGKKKVDRYGKDIIEMIGAFHDRRPLPSESSMKDKNAPDGPRMPSNDTPAPLS